jgi:methylated-DNA-[protein]-cysteine S-methyltransferase
MSRAIQALHPTPLGPVLLAAGQGGLSGLRFGEARVPGVERLPLLRATGEQLDAYFAGELREFELPIRAEGTPLQLAVWSALGDVPFGTTVSYGDLAARIDPDLFDPRAEPWQRPRIVGAALGRNPTPLVVPCHRVIGADGSLTGYAGGIWRKKALIDLERVALGGAGGRRAYGSPAALPRVSL